MTVTIRFILTEYVEQAVSIYSLCLIVADKRKLYTRNIMDYIQ